MYIIGLIHERGRIYILCFEGDRYFAPQISTESLKKSKKIRRLRDGLGSKKLDSVLFALSLLSSFQVYICM